MILLMASAFQAGYAEGENGQVGFILREKFGWERKSKSFIDLTTLSTVMGPIGLAVGS